ncbi:MAG: tannase/feruloyl esterase family alpha/beta hydrolase [Rhodobacteraceae bacterium]|jgi:pimeloyl-ACP methyl ester carboxylesterase|uniref:Feruloyl esterase n=1 Tax=Salipiger profundus TaxID=1229727 RepID=A0A1U7D5N1_9RHOB|nr:MULTISPECIES: tannase/feruloyl esterase family alpha/beta hydrolase [Salipiger]APX23449.1 feruloyl esterase [Salipiger profundus]MAB07939.1 tannase/feruloyl esterase family alpha/beta hydrolase [Paracoccaceae bacterium]GGA20334.1 feruloyl esterase [Salipiger profundus]SFC88484.1 feruloyl esterase [Salipiger profundus]
MKYLFPAMALAMAASVPQQGQAQQSPEQCRALRSTVMDAASVTSARVMPALDTLPSYCEVRVTARPAISIEVRLPMEGWNGKYYQAGCGGFCGILGRADAGGGWVNAMRPGLERGYATATSDSGHHGLSVTEATWAMGNPDAERDWGWRSIGETHRVAQALIGAFYDGASEQAVFQGCSTGGRMAHMAAQRYPDLFDGIIAGAPAMDYTGLVGTAMSWVVQANTAEDGSQILGPHEAKLIGDEVMSQCDGADGKADGLIADPRACEIDLAPLTCEAEDKDSCLDEQELATLTKWREGPRNAAGDQLYPGGIPEGSEPYWWLWLTGNDKGAGKLVPAFAKSFGSYMAFPTDPGPEWTPADFDFETDPARLETMAEVYNADSPDLSAFRNAGGKMIVWHGWADSIVTPYKTVKWYEDAARISGGEDGLKDTVALFMVPGLDHCGILPGTDGLSAASLDPMSPLERWMTDGTRPTSIMAPE